MGIDASARAGAVGITTSFQDLSNQNILFLAQKIGIVGQGASASTYATTKAQVTSAKEVGDTYGYGSPLYAAALQVFPDNGDGVGTIPVIVHPLEDGYGAVAATGDITPSGTATAAGEYYVRIGGIASSKFTIPAGVIVVADVVDDMVTAINGILAMLMTASDGATVLNLTANFAGTSGNELEIEVVGPSVGVSFAITQPNGGLVNPTVTAALTQIGDDWETMIVNCLEADDTAALDEYQTWGDGRWGTLVHKPAIVFSAETEPDRATATTVTAARTDDKVNCQLVAPGSSTFPAIVAAREVARIAKIANNKPANDYAGQVASGILPGTDAEQWDHTVRDAALKAGSSTIVVRDSNVVLKDTVTMYAPVGETNPAYRYVRDIVVLQQAMFNISAEFESDNWEGKPLIPDDQPTVNPEARKPKSAIAAMNSIIDGLGEWALISDPATAKKKTTAVIDSGNPKRLNVGTTIQISGVAGIIDVDLSFGFFFG